MPARVAFCAFVAWWSFRRCHASGFSPSFIKEASGVGHAAGDDEDALADVARTDISRRYATPLRIEPQSGQISEYEAERPKNVCCGVCQRLSFQIASGGGEKPGDVLEEDDGRLDLGDDARHVGPEPALVGDAAPLAGRGHWLTWKSRHDAIHCATPRAAVEGDEVIPDRSLIQPAVLHARRQNRGGIGFPLHVTDDASASHSAAKSTLEAADAGAEAEHAEGR